MPGMLIKRFGLSGTQVEELAAWYQIGRISTAGYDAGELHMTKSTLLALHRRGLTCPPHRGYPDGWRAPITAIGLEVARDCYELVAAIENA